MKDRRITAAALAMVMSSCITTGHYVRTGNQRLPARPPNCSFALYTASPPSGSIEVGVVEFRNAGSTNGAISFEDARAAAAPHVCAAGGDGLVISTFDPTNGIPMATIIKTPAAVVHTPAGAP